MHIGASTVGLLLLALAFPARAGGQSKPWGIGFDAGLTRFWGASEPVPPNVTPGARPYRPTTFAIRADRIFGRSRVGLTVSYAGSGLGVENQDLAIIAKGGLTWVQLAPELAYRLATLGPVTELRLFGGPVADLWNVDGDDTRTRIGGRAGLELLVPLGGPLAATMRAHGGLSGSLFREADVPSGYRTKTMPNAGFALGFRFGF
ncbi:MAG TPA: hypothetical protein VEU27_03880 [Gemmatimonadales bacterium]|nr:hypothetical protein [Gemmatimonadales bacterium]